MSSAFDYEAWITDRGAIRQSFESRVGTAKGFLINGWMSEGCYRLTLRAIGRERRALARICRSYHTACEPERTIIHNSEGDNGSATA